MGAKRLLSKTLTIVTIGLFFAPLWAIAQNAVSRTTLSVEQVPTELFDQAIDHNRPEAGTFKQRYWIISDFAKGPDAPVLYYLGEESDAAATSAALGIDYAQAIGARVVLVEHRYYGQSQPQPDLSNQSLRYLTIEQALEDFKALQEHLMGSEISKDAKWIALGYSYVGLLAANYRARYPNLVVGALASSAPMIFPDGNQSYDQFASTMMQKQSPQCLAMTQTFVNDILKKTGKYRFENKFVFNKTSRELGLPMGIRRDVIADNVANIFTELGQTQQIDEFCSDLSNSTESSLVLKVRDAIAQIYINPTLNFYMTDETLASSYEEMTTDQRLLIFKVIPGDRATGKESWAELTSQERSVFKSALLQEWRLAYVRGFFLKDSWKSVQQTSLANAGAVGWRQFIYQECTELGYLQIASQDRSESVTPALVDRNWFHNTCQHLFGATPNVNETTKKYFQPLSSQAQNPVTNVIAITGTEDPWSVLSALPNDSRFSPGIVRILIDGGGHCADAYPDSPYGNSYAQILAAHTEVEKIMTGWLAK